MKLILTSEQREQIEPHLRPEITLLARVERLAFDGSNAATSGALVLLFA